MKASMQREKKAKRRTGEKLSHQEKLEARREKDRDRKREKARRNSTTASRRSSPVGSFFFDLISTLLIRSFQVQSPPPMAGKLWGHPRTIGPEPVEYGCIWETENEDRDRREAWERRRGSKKLKKLRAEANSLQRKLRKEAEDARKGTIDPQVRFRVISWLLES